MYLDPGFGSMLIQVIVAVIAAAGAYILIFKKSIAGFFQKLRGGKSKAETKNEDGGSAS
jgi:hypothetical protein